MFRKLQVVPPMYSYILIICSHFSHRDVICSHCVIIHDYFLWFKRNEVLIHESSLGLCWVFGLFDEIKMIRGS